MGRPRAVPRRRRLSRDEIEAELGTTGGFSIPLRPGRRSGLLWVALLLVIAALALVGGLPGGSKEGVDLKRVLQPFPTAPSPTGRTPQGAAAIGRDVQQTWKDLFAKAGVDFRPAKIVVFNRVMKSKCGLARPAATNAFYCASSSELHLNRDLHDSYLIAHVYAHHVQELLGITDQIARAEDASSAQARDLWRKHELQADCLAGVWAHSALRGASAASAPQRATIPVQPDRSVDGMSWARASREQRASSFQRGYDSGNASACDTFSRDA
jgi:uncharacterized protein